MLGSAGRIGALIGIGVPSAPGRGMRGTRSWIGVCAGQLVPAAAPAPAPKGATAAILPKSGISGSASLCVGSLTLLSSAMRPLAEILLPLSLTPRPVAFRARVRGNAGNRS